MESRRDRPFGKEGGGVLRDHGVGMVDAEHEEMLAFRDTAPVPALRRAGGEFAGAEDMLGRKSREPIP